MIREGFANNANMDVQRNKILIIFYKKYYITAF